MKKSQSFAEVFHLGGAADPVFGHLVSREGWMAIAARVEAATMKS